MFQILVKYKGKFKLNLGGLNYEKSFSINGACIFEC